MEAQKPLDGPIWRPLGWSPSRVACYKPWLWLWSKTSGILKFRPSQVGSLNALTLIHPDLAFWREQFPYSSGGLRVDGDKAREVFVRLCFAAGEYEPPPELKPRGRGRPRKDGLR